MDSWSRIQPSGWVNRLTWRVLNSESLFAEPALGDEGRRDALSSGYRSRSADANASEGVTAKPLDLRLEVETSGGGGHVVG
jgi:hypothetical protein